MLYTKIKNTSFVASNHYNKYLKLDYQPTFLFPKRIPTPKLTSNKIHSVNKYDLDYNEYKFINELSKNYMRSLKGNLSPDNFLPHLLKAELTGASIKTIKSKNYGFIIEERVNSIFVLYENNIVKMFIKKNNNFVVELDGVEYLFFGENLKKNRFFKK